MNEDTSRKRGPGRPRKADAGDTKAALRQAALRLFARQGYAGTSIRAIAGEVGLSDSVLYAHFASKQAIFDAVLAEYGPQSSADALASVDLHLADTDPPLFLRDLVRAFLDEWDNRESRLLISLMARDGLLHGPGLREALSVMRASVADLFDRWIRAGHIPAHLGTPQALALSFTGPIGLTRILHLHADAAHRERATAREEILQHVETFTRAVFERGVPSRTNPTT
ncbi:MAG: TetR family transcriptional regulator [Streptosporangiales bacterium]|nr:TetR family transcriptional regulator [Streptosporangiales bacterium]